MNRRIKNIILRLGLLAGIGLFIALSIAAKINRDREEISGIRVNIDESRGHFFVSKEEVLQLSGQIVGKDPAFLTGSDLDMLEDRLSELPFIREVRAFVDNNATLTINITQRKPILRVIPIQGTSFYVDREGYKFPLKSGYTAKVPVVTGFIPENNVVTGPISSNNLQRVFTIARYVSRDPFWSAQFAQYQLVDNGGVEVIPRLGEHIIVLGDEKDLEGKLKRLDIFYNEVLRNIGWDIYQRIDVQFNNQIICQKNKTSST
jgi:cell division protein FtsQ